MEEIRYRMATPADAGFVAEVVAETLGNPIMERIIGGQETAEDRQLLEQLTAVCKREDTLYSWKNTRLAVTRDNRPVAALVAYPGEGYMDCRKRTFALLGSLIAFYAEKMEPETRDGEYYLDSISVHPHWRGKGIARVMMAEAAREAARMGRPAILACAPDNTGAKKLYESIGFHEEGHMFIFGEDYLRMVSSSVTSSSSTYSSLWLTWRSYIMRRATRRRSVTP